jgi:tetratricopeptide (TPR) repeat protein
MTMTTVTASLLQTKIDQGDDASYFRALEAEILEHRHSGDWNQLVERLSLYGRNQVWSGRIKLGCSSQSEAALIASRENLTEETLSEFERNWAEIHIAMGNPAVALSWLGLHGPGETTKRQTEFFRIKSMAFGVIGNTDEALEASRLHLETARACGSERNIARAYRNMAHQMIRKLGRFDESAAESSEIRRNIDHARAHAEKGDNVDVFSAVAFTHATYFAAMGRYPEAIGIARQSYEETLRYGYAHRSMLLATLLARSELEQGDMGAASRWADIAHVIALGDGDPYCFAGELPRIRNILERLDPDTPPSRPGGRSSAGAETAAPHVLYDEEHKRLERAVSARGFRIYNKNLIWHKDQDFLDLFRRFAPDAAVVNDRKYTLYSLAKYASYLAGDTVECGVLEGASSFLICCANADKGGDFHHHVFDSFEGLSEPMPEDAPATKTARAWSAGDLAVEEEVVIRNLSRFGFVKTYKGWIPERFEEVADRWFSLVHIDVDFHQPTLDSLRFFYDRTVPGGFIICDDYGFENCRGAKLAFDAFINEKPERQVISLPTGQGLIVKF